MKLRRTLAAVAVGAALAAPAVVATASPASAAATQYANLSIVASQVYPGYYDVYVFGHFNTTTSTTSVGMRLKGDDPIFNDDLGVSAVGQASYGDFSLHALVWHRYLNEDPEGRDEVFAAVRSSTGWSADTADVYGYF